MTSERTRIIGVFVFSIVCILLIAYFGLNSIRKFNASNKLVFHTQQVMNTAQELQGFCQEIETKGRGFAITGDEDHLARYDSSKNDRIAALNKLEKLTATNPKQLAIIQSLKTITAEKVAFSDEVVTLVRKKGKEAGQQHIISNRGLMLMNEIRGLIQKLIRSESDLLAERKRLNEENYTSTFRSIVFGIILSVIILIAALILMLRGQNKRKLVEKQIRDNRFQLKQFLDSIPLPVFIVDADRKPFYANKEALGMMGLNNLSDIQNHNMFDNLYYARTGKPFVPTNLPLGEIFKNSMSLEINDLMIKKGGKFIDLKIGSVAVTNSDGEISFAMSVVQDVSIQKKIEEELERAKKNAEDSEKQKEIFLTNMSHEMRTPLNAIIGFGSLLSETNLSKEQADYLDTIRSSSENLLHIINDILDLSKIQSGYLKVERHPFDIQRLFHEIEKVHRQEIKQKKQQLNIRFEGEVPQFLEGDAQRLRQVVTNLLNNAIKFTNEGRIDINIRVKEKLPDEQYRLEFKISDNGIGIDEEKLPSIFERFTQGEFDENRAYGGTGIGLNITKFIVEKQGGSIKVDSQKNVGTTFTVTLPYWSISNDNLNLLKESKTGDKFSEKTKTKAGKILLVEDNFLNRKLARRIIEDFGYELETAEHGKEALEKIAENVYDLILMDLQMPEMDGYQTTSVLRHELNIQTAIIAMTAHSLEGERKKCIEMGMDDYISKPFQVEELKLKITAGILLSRKRESNDEESKKWSELHKLLEEGNLIQAKMLVFTLKKEANDASIFEELEQKIQQNADKAVLLEAMKRLKNNNQTEK